MSDVAVEPAAPPLDRARILLVEDSETQALQLRRMLEAQGFAVTRAATAEMALESLNGALPDLVIADYHLPGMNGDELARQIRLNSRTRSIPVLMLTEAREGHVEQQGLESGADLYVAKSADQGLLLLRLKALLRGRGTAPAALPATVPAAAAFRRARLLVVDGSATYRAYLTGLLTRDGYAVEAVADAEAALRAVAAAPQALDCVLVNALSSGFDGIDLCARLDALRGPDALRNGSAPGFQIIALGSDDPTGREAQGQVVGAGVVGAGTVGVGVLEGAVPGAGISRGGIPRANIAGAGILGAGILGAGILEAGVLEAGADDLIPALAEAKVLSLRIRAALRRKLLQDEDRRGAAELRDREAAIARAHAEAAAAQAKAALAEALARANTELENANRQLKDTQTKLVQAAKMASLGELVAGIAHEINNPLAFILAHQGTVERLLRQIEPMLGEHEAARPLLMRARSRAGSMTLGLTRIQDLVLNLRKFSRQEDAFQLVDVPDALDTVLALLAHKLGDRIVVQRQYEATPQLRCSPALLHQVVMNILSNAADAIEGQGQIRLATQNDAVSYAITICDSGPGVPDDLRDRIFEPFFTTKPVGAGTGLGLAIAYNVIRAHDGSISVGDGPDGGACFVVRVPIPPDR